MTFGYLTYKRGTAPCWSAQVNVGLGSRRKPGRKIMTRCFSITKIRNVNQKMSESTLNKGEVNEICCLDKQTYESSIQEKLTLKLWM